MRRNRKKRYHQKEGCGAGPSRPPLNVGSVLCLSHESKDSHRGYTSSLCATGCTSIGGRQQAVRKRCRGCRLDPERRSLNRRQEGAAAGLIMMQLSPSVKENKPVKGGGRD